jgi:hypothetical protein
MQDGGLVRSKTSLFRDMKSMEISSEVIHAKPILTLKNKMDRLLWTSVFHLQRNSSMWGR